MFEFSHKPVLLREVMDMLALKEGMTVIDGTLGGGGHSAEILKLIGKAGKLIGIDRDNDALEFCKKKFAGCDSFIPVKANYSDMKKYAASLA